MQDCPRVPNTPKSELCFSSQISDFSDRNSILEDFRDLRWMPSKSVHLNYANSQILLIGERSGIDKATEPQDEEQKKCKDNKEVLENLEEDDLVRMQHLGEDESESIFADLHVQAKDYPALQLSF